MISIILTVTLQFGCAYSSIAYLIRHFTKREEGSHEDFRNGAASFMQIELPELCD